MTDVVKTLLKSRRFWAAAAAVAVKVFEDRLPLTPEQITDIVMLVGAWIVGESIRSSTLVAPASTEEK